jgi:hypothetical protein
MPTPTTTTPAAMRDALPFVLIAVGGALLLYGGSPVWHALIVWNRMMHEGEVNLQDMDDWDQWAVTPRFIISAAIGVILLAAGSVLSLKSKLLPFFKEYFCLTDNFKDK